jgi:hypothetical protein
MVATSDFSGLTSSPCALASAAAIDPMARRYGLFTQVGIAGEDDVDAPDLAAPTQQPLGRERLEAGFEWPTG